MGPVRTTKHVLNQLAKRVASADHRLIGAKQKLFIFDELSQGSAFFLPRGAHIYNTLVDFLRAEYKERGYQEVITPNIYDCRLWQTSGHWDHYGDNMIKFKIADRDFSLKPMNCPGHCLMYNKLGPMKDRNLPLRFADFGALHRNELSGSLLGLSRVRRFQQDDAHIFCTANQIESEVKSCIDFANDVYSSFDLNFNLALSLRPNNYMGDPLLWDKAEESLRRALESAKLDWIEQENEGAFYGPKIDLIIKDCHGRSQQCATIQLDFQLPQRFELVYKETSGDKTTQTPVMIHRAILGSIERFIAMMAENCEGRWPFWLSPLQAQVIPVSENANNYALSVTEQLARAGFMVDGELDPTLTLNKKIRNAEIVRYNFILVVGDKEAENNSVTVRLTIDKKTHQITVPTEKLVELLKELKDKRVKQADRAFLAAVT